MDWMGEYDSAGHSGGTNQHISHGTFLKTVTIMPAKTTGTNTNGDIQAALKANLASGVLPAPMRDPVEGQVNTLYMVYFPPGLIIDDGTGSKSCTGWWAYHGALSGVSGVNSGALYGVIPDFSTGRCSMGCGGNNVSSTECMTCTSAHELLEAMSDADN